MKTLVVTTVSGKEHSFKTDAEVAHLVTSSFVNGTSGVIEFDKFGTTFYIPTEHIETITVHND